MQLLSRVEGESKIKVGNRYDPYASFHQIHHWQIVLVIF